MKLASLTDGILKNNAIFRQMLGMCPTLAVTTSALNSIAMGLATLFVLTFSNMAISMCRNVIPQSVRIPSFIVIIATFATIVDLLMNAYVHELHKILGIFIPLIVVNCIVLGRAESFASKNKVADSALDGFGSGLGFTLGLFVIGSVREIIGSGTIFGFSLFTESFQPAILIILPPGAFIVLGFLMALLNWFEARRAGKEAING